MMKTVLVVEDSPTTRKHIALGLRSAGYRVVAAADGMEALELLSQPENNADLIVTDLNMPNLDGLGLIRAIRFTDRHLPIVILSSAMDQVSRQNGLEAGADRYLTKPFDSSLLLTEIGELLGETSLHQEAEVAVHA